MSLINREALYEKACGLEAQALAHVGKIANDDTKIEEWRIWSAILAERTAFKHDIFDAPEVKPEPKWIPTSKKPDPDLPEDDMSGYFLVTLHTYGNIGFDMDEYKVEKMRWNRVNGWVLPVHSPAWIEEALTQDVLAWKPCPEPYREDGAE